MPRINPQSLLKCLQVLLNKDGGIQGPSEVKRMVALMKKFSNTLVSKVCYTLILKETQDELISEFMGEGGWGLIFQWLGDAITTSNSAFIKEVLELLIKCPISLERLKESNAPRTIKGLSKESDDAAVRELARQLVEMWLDFIKSGRAAVEPPPVVTPSPVITDPEPVPEVANEEDVSSPPPTTLQPFKIVVRDGKRVLVTVGADDAATPPKVKRVDKVADVSERVKPLKVREPEVKPEKALSETVRPKPKEVHRSESKKDHEKRKESDKVRKDRKDAPKSHSSSHSHKSPTAALKSPRESTDKLKDKKKERSRVSDKAKEIREKFNALSKSRKEKENKIERERKLSASDLDDMPPRKTPAISSLGKIPKKTTTSDTISAAEASATGGVLGGSSTSTPPKEPVPLPTAKKGSYSDERKRTAEMKPSERPKTVKTAPTKFRSTGLEEEAKPPAPRPSVKKDRPESSGKDKDSSSSKRPLSSPKESKGSPHEKKSRPSESKDSKETKINEVKEKIEKHAEKPGGIKLIPPKPKPVLLESDLFSDALTASTKNEPRKKKRRSSSSGTKDADVKKEKEEKEESTKHKSRSSSSTSATSPPRDREKDKEKDRDNKPLKFYRDTLEETAVKQEETSEEKEDVVAPRHKLYPEGVLVVLRSSKAPKKSVRWRDANLVAVKLFELDENERVNVTRQNFMDMKAMDRTQERQALMMGRKMGIEESGIDKMPWRPLVVIDVPAEKQAPAWGSNSQEKEIQAARQKTVLEAIFFSKSMIPDSPAEPDQEYHPMTDPKSIPLEDTTGGAEATYDYSSTGWPEPKPEEKLDTIVNTAVPPYAGYSSFPQYNVAPPNTDNWMAVEPPKDPVTGLAYPPGVAPMYGMPGYTTTPPPTAEGFPMPMYPHGYPMQPPMFGGMGPPPGMWGGWTGPRPPPMPLDTRNICRAFASTGCKFGIKCRYLHPGVNCPPLPS